MALIRCSGCGREISDRAKSCPNCGMIRTDMQFLANDILNDIKTEMFEKNIKELIDYPTISILCQNDKTNYAEKNDDKKSKSRTEVSEINRDETGESGCNDELELKSACRKGDIIKIGNYMGKPIEWLVLKVKNNIALIISKNVLDVMPYHDELLETSWEECSLRRYLNGEFIDKAFLDKEKILIHQVEIKNNYNNETDITRNDNVYDRVFCLSKYEVVTYFPDKYSRRADVTSHAKEKVKRSERKYFMSKWSGTGNYWLRTLMDKKDYAMFVDYDGELMDTDVSNEWMVGIRPALWINLEGFDELRDITHIYTLF